MDTARVGAPPRVSIYRFKLEKELGRGGSGIVYRSIDTKSGAVVAVKIFRADFFRNKLHLRDFAKSVGKFRKFSHPNVTGIYEFIDGEEGTCLIQEFVDGPDLKWYLANRRFDLQERLVIVAQICNGLQYIHEQGFTHHDLKPANILFTRKGVVKLTDFSLCGSSFLLNLFDSNTFEQVTPMYVAPELIRKEKATAHSDIYSLGVTLYLIFTGRVPFEMDNLQALYQCHLRAMPLHPCYVNAECPGTLGDIIMRMMNKDPKKRFRDCDELRIALADIGKSRI